MTRAVYIEDGGTRRAIAERNFPLALGGSDAFLALPGMDVDRPTAHLGLAEGRVFVQPAEGASVFCNGARLSTSQWLEHGDILRIGEIRIAVHVSLDRFELRVQRPEKPSLREPQPASPAPTVRSPVRSAEPRGRRIPRVEFRPTYSKVPTRRRRRLFYVAAAALIPLALSLALLWNLTREPAPPSSVQSTAQSELEIAPEVPAVEEADAETDAVTTAEQEPLDSETAINPVPEPPPAPPRPVVGTLELTSRPPGASVTVDGEYRGETPLRLELPPDVEHRIELTRAGHDPLERSVSLRVEERRELVVELPERRGDVEIRARPEGAEVLVDGRSHGVVGTTLNLLAVPHEIEIRKDGYVSVKQTVTPRSGLTQSIDVVLKTSEQIREEARVPVIRTSLGQELVLIDGGRFVMGAPRREPGRRSNETQREVQLTRPFYLGTREVSNGEFRKFRGKHRSGAVQGHSLERDDHPVVRVEWSNAARYCNWLSKQDGLPPAYQSSGGTWVLARPTTTGYRLPTEAEWAWAVRYQGGGDPRKYAWGNGLPVAAGSGNYADEAASAVVRATLDAYRDGFITTAPTGSFAPNELGLFNTGGNVAEWVNDRYTVYGPSEDLHVDPLGAEHGEHHVIRGASWMDSKISELRLSYRDYGSEFRPDVGFRIARWAE